MTNRWSAAATAAQLRRKLLWLRKGALCLTIKNLFGFIGCIGCTFKSTRVKSSRQPCSRDIIFYSFTSFHVRLESGDSGGIIFLFRICIISIKHLKKKKSGWLRVRAENCIFWKARQRRAGERFPLSISCFPLQLNALTYSQSQSIYKKTKPQLT